VDIVPFFCARVVDNLANPDEMRGCPPASVLPRDYK
jgi:hypothetical protein